EPSGHAGALSDAALDHRRFNFIGESRSRSRENVVDVDFSAQGRKDIDSLLAGEDIELQALGGRIDMARRKVRVRAQAIPPGLGGGRRLDPLAILVVAVDDCKERRTAAIAFEKQTLGCEIILHRFMEVQMIPSEVGEDRRVKAEAKHATK